MRGSDSSPESNRDRAAVSGRGQRLRGTGQRPCVPEDASNADSYPGYPAGDVDYHGWFAHDDGGTNEGTDPDAEVR